MNLEYLLVDSRTFITNEEGALSTFFGSAVDSSTSYRVEIEVGRASGWAAGRGRQGGGIGAAEKVVSKGDEACEREGLRERRDCLQRVCTLVATAAQSSQQLAAYGSHIRAGRHLTAGDCL